MNLNYNAPAPVSYEQHYETAQLSCVIVLNGVRYPCISASWTENAHGATDQAKITIPLSVNKDFTVTLFRGDYTYKLDASGNPYLVSPGTPGAKVVAIYPNGTTALVPAGTALPAGAKISSNNSPVYVEIWAGFPQNQAIGSTDISQLKRKFYGQVDLYTGSFDKNGVTFTCRSIGAALVDNRLQNISGSQTMKDLLTQQAVRYGLPPPVVTYVPGSKPATIQEILAYDQVGGSNYFSTLYGMRVWDMAIRGAQVDDVDVWVDIATGTIHYEAPKQVSRNVVDLKYGRDWMELGASHAPNFSKTIQVQVHAHQPHSKVSTTIRVSNDADGNLTTAVNSKFTSSDAVLGTNQTVGSSSTTSSTGTTSTSTTISSSFGGNFNASIGQGAGESAIQKYNFYVGNVSPERATTMAQAFWRQISQHEFAIEGKVPITNRLLASLSITSLLRVHGTPWSLVNTSGLSGDAYYPRALDHEISVENGWTCTIQALNNKLAGNAV